MKSTVNLRINTCTNEQVHYCSITKVQFGVSLKLNTLQDYSVGLNKLSHTDLLGVDLMGVDPVGS